MAEVKILVEGNTNADSKDNSGEEKTCPTITLVKDGNFNIVVDPGILESQDILVEALKKEDLTVDDIDMIFLTHSHFDHFRNLGMFPKAKTLEYFGLWDKNTITERKEQLTDNIKIIETPGHSSDALTMLVNTKDGIVAICGDVFWKENEPEDDPYASEPEKLKGSRKIVSESADYIIPGHGKMFKVK